MLAWHVPFLGWRRLPVDISEIEIAHFFTLNPVDIHAVRSRYKEDLRLGAALQLGFLTMCGRPLDSLQRIPVDLLRHLGAQLDIAAPDIATIRAIYRRRRATLFEHQTWAIAYLDMRRLQPRDQNPLMGPLTAIVRAGVFGDHLRSATRRLLYEQRIIISGHRRLEDLIRNATTKVELEALQSIEREIPAQTRDRWVQALRDTVGDSSLTLMEYLQEPPGKFSPATIKRQFNKVQRLRDLGVSKYLIASLTPSQLQAYAQGMRRRRPSRTVQLREARRTLELASFLQYSLCEHTDLLIRLIDRRGSQLWRRASEEARRRRGESTAADAFVTGIRAILARTDVPADARVGAVESLLAQLDSGTLRAPCPAARQREVLVSYSAQIRPLVQMLLALELRCDKASIWSRILLNWTIAYNQDLDCVSARMRPTSSRAWTQLCQDTDGARAFHAGEAHLRWEARQALRRGSLYAPHSFSFRSPEVLFDQRGTTVRAPGSTRDPEQFLDQLCAQLEVTRSTWPRPLSSKNSRLKARRFTNTGSPLTTLRPN